MRAVCQRVSEASVRVDGRVVGAIGRGWLVLLGIGPEDTTASCAWLVDRLSGLRVFDDAAGKMNLSAREVGAAFLVVSQFTLYADTSRGRRPGFSRAAAPDLAAALVDRAVDLLRADGFTVATGQFGANMAVQLVNDGPLTIVLTNDGWA